MIILAGVLTTQNEAVNETNATNGTSNTTNTQENSNTTTQNTNQTEEPEISSNANLSILGIRPHDFTGFRYGTTSYKVEVPKDVEEIEVYASAQHEKATVTGTGKKTLELGENQVDVTVTAEDGTKKTYTIYITRGKTKDENSENESNQLGEEKGLKNLKINNLSLVPEFRTNQYEYTVQYIGEDTKLKIETESTKDDYIVEVVGNENIQEGEKLITILVSESDGNNIATYQVTVNKSLEDKEAIAKQEEQKKAKQKIIVIGAVVGIVIIGAIGITIVVIQKRNRDLENEFSGNSYYEEDFYEEEEEDEVPKALKGRRFQEEEKESSQNGYQPIDEAFEKMPKDELREEFLKGYTSQIDIDFDNEYETKRLKGKHKGKRFK